ncbi:hypothetical protein [Ideonella sp.]|uniref:hypothetical protein n=1 Tax=Ideonella sp. TaxID=1929293 RepID=UPI003BB804A3
MRFARCHKYTVGLELRSAAMGLMRQFNQAVHDRACQLQHVQALVWQVDAYKLTLQLAMDIGAFKHTVRGSAPRPSPSFHAFEQAAALAAAIGKPFRGWCQALARLQRTLSSCYGHFTHASTWHLRHALWRRHGWLGVLFCMDAQGSLHQRWVLQGSTFAQQVSSLRQQWPQARTVVHKGAERLHFPPSAAADGSRVHAVQTGWLRHGTRRREIVQWHRVPAVPDAPATIP